MRDGRTDGSGGDLPALTRLATESRHPGTTDLDAMSVTELLSTMNAEDRTVADAVAAVVPSVAEAVELVVSSLRAGGRLVYLGAGTSGRLGLLDAAECPPTFDTDPGQVVALLAGGPTAVTSAVEGAEDDAGAGSRDVDDLEIGPHDTVVGLAASGRTPYVVGGLARARARGAATVSVSCNARSPIGVDADVAIEVLTGPEVLTGSTRLKAGTAQKMVCNMISTAAMVRLGKVYENLMIDMRPTNAKLADRAERIVAEAARTDRAAARAALERAGGDAKLAVLGLVTGADPGRAGELLAAGEGSVRRALAAWDQAGRPSRG